MLVLVEVSRSPRHIRTSHQHAYRAITFNFFLLMDASPVHTCKDTTPSADNGCKENESPSQSINKKRKREDEHDRDEFTNPFFRSFVVTVGSAVAETSRHL